MISISELYAGYENKEILHGVSETLPDGKISVIIGPNGSGKSTLLRSIVRLLPEISGTILLNEKPLAELSRQELAKKIAYLPQSRNVPDITVERLVMHGRFPYLSYPRRYSKEDREIVKKALEMTGLTELAGSKLEDLSGGQRQKTYLAMVLAQDTEVILMDEPTTWLDIRNQLEFLKLVRTLADSGKTIIMILHDFEQVLQFADKVVLMEKGKIVMAGEAVKVLSSDEINQVYNIKTFLYDTEDGLHCYVKM